MYVCILICFQVKMLHALNATDKSDLLSLMFAIEKTFSPYWDNYKPYVLLQKRVDNLRNIINDKQSNGTDGRHSRVTHIVITATWYIHTRASCTRETVAIIIIINDNLYSAVCAESTSRALTEYK